MSQGSETDRPKGLSVPAASPARYARNLIRSAVCELRFPTLFELEEQVPPADFARALRKEYPTHEYLTNLNINPTGVAQARAHAFRSKKNAWTVTLRASAMALETAAYTSFAEMTGRLEVLVEAARATIDSEFFTRVGLRYINALPCKVDEVSEWLNPSLGSALGSGIFGVPTECWQRVSGPTSLGAYTLLHGIGGTNADGNPSYVLDLDFFKEDVRLDDALSTVQQLHAEEFSLFSWAMGPRGKAFLGESTV